MKTSIIVITGSGPGAMQKVIDIDLPAVPLPGEHIDFGGRKYRTLERSWRIQLTSPLPEPPASEVSVGLLVEQIGGPPHVLLNSGGLEPN